MKGTYLGEFQEIVLLAILILEDNAYGVSIQSEIKARVKRNISRGALHAALTRLEKKGFVRSGWSEATNERGGRRKRLFTITQEGETALIEIRSIRDRLWGRLPNLGTKLSFS